MDFERIITSAPVDAKAARQMGRGEVWVPTLKLMDWSEAQPKTAPVSAALRRDPLFKDYTAQTFGRLTVLGLVADRDKGARWVCRCKCGDYCTRTSKSLRVAAMGGNSFVPMCGRCDYINRLRNGWSPEPKRKTA
jgi:hypothetical protein